VLTSLPKPIKNFKHFLESFAQKPHSAFALFVLSVAESSLLPIPLDVFFMPLSLAQPKRAILNSMICVLGSTLGAVIGYYLGYALFETVGAYIVNYFGWMELFDNVLLKYKEHATAALLLAGFTPIPFEVFTYAAGFNRTIPLATFIAAVLAGRSLRFLPVGIALYFFGSGIRGFVAQYFGKIALALPIIILIWFIMTKYFL
jgi:membrane protein YqaA with SNARE-associated domain